MSGIKRAAKRVLKVLFWPFDWYFHSHFARVEAKLDDLGKRFDVVVADVDYSSEMALSVQRELAMLRAELNAGREKTTEVG